MSRSDTVQGWACGPTRRTASRSTPPHRSIRSSTRSFAGDLGLAAEDSVDLKNSNKLTLRLAPCNVLARVTPPAQQGEQEGARFELDLAQQLAEAGCPVGALDPRVHPAVYQVDGFVVTLWTYYEPVPHAEVPAADYAAALERLHDPTDPTEDVLVKQVRDPELS